MKTLSGTSDASCTGECPCFPGDAIVTLDNGNTKKMSELAVGDKVLTHNGVFSEVFMFSHRLEEATYNFVEIKTATATLAITGNHYLYINGNLREAQYVSAGDTVTLASGKSYAVIVNNTPDAPCGAFVAMDRAEGEALIALLKNAMDDADRLNSGKPAFARRDPGMVQ